MCDKLSLSACPPAHYLARIDSVTELLKLQELKFGPFEVGGYKWWLQLELTPPEKKKCMSLYLVIDEPSEVLVDYKFFVFYYKEEKYTIFKERGNRPRKFSRRDTRWGFSNFLSLDDFKRKYCQGDQCKIGAELLVTKLTRRVARLTIKNPSPTVYTEKSLRFSASESKPRYSGEFRLEGISWKFKVCSQRSENRRYLSVHLEAQDISSGKLLFVEASLCVSNTDLRKNRKHAVKGWLNANNKTCGKSFFMRWGDLNGGFIHWNERNECNELKLAVKIHTIIDGARTDEPIQ